MQAADIVHHLFCLVNTCLQFLYLIFRNRVFARLEQFNLRHIDIGQPGMVSGIVLGKIIHPCNFVKRVVKNVFAVNNKVFLQNFGNKFKFCLFRAKVGFNRHKRFFFGIIVEHIFHFFDTDFGIANSFQIFFIDVDHVVVLGNRLKADNFQCQAIDVLQGAVNGSL